MSSGILGEIAEELWRKYPSRTGDVHRMHRRSLLRKHFNCSHPTQLAMKRDEQLIEGLASLKKDKSGGPPLSVGDKVICLRHQGSTIVTRTITAVRPDPSCRSGWRASADNGGQCPTCGRNYSRTWPKDLQVDMYKLLEKAKDQ